MKKVIKKYGVIFQRKTKRLTRHVKKQVPTSLLRKKKQTMPWSRLAATAFLIFCAGMLFLGIRGNPGNPSIGELHQDRWKDEGPLELSPERGRFALLYSIVEEGSFHFSVPVARFAAPDVVYTNEHFASMFAPGVSYIVIPGYLLGKLFGYSQIGTFAVIAFFALMNAMLVRAIAIRLLAAPLAASIGAMAFLFATPAFSYAVTLYQHHISTFMILAGVYLLIRFNSFLSLAAIWFLCAASVVVDYPNLFMMFPIGIAALGKIFRIEQTAKNIAMQIRFTRIFSFIAIIIPVLFFLWFNTQSYGNPFQLSGTLQRAQEIGTDGKPVQNEAFLLTQKALSEVSQSEIITTGFFRTRLLINGFYTHFISADRGVLLYAPIVLFAIPAIVVAYRRGTSSLSILLSIMGINILLYSMWDDPYGGWAFGSRYLIPTYAITGILIGIFLTHWRRSLLILLSFFLVFLYATSVNTLGAITSNRNPPRVEIGALEQQTGRPEPYTYARNFQFLDEKGSKSFVYQQFASRYISPTQYHWLLTACIAATAGLLLIAYPLKEKRLYRKETV